MGGNGWGGIELKVSALPAIAVALNVACAAVCDSPLEQLSDPNAQGDVKVCGPVMRLHTLMWRGGRVVGRTFVPACAPACVLAWPVIRLHLFSQLLTAVYAVLDIT